MTETTHSLIEDVAQMLDAHGCKTTASDLRDTKRVIPDVPVSPKPPLVRHRCSQACALAVEVVADTLRRG